MGRGGETTMPLHPRPLSTLKCDEGRLNTHCSEGRAAALSKLLLLLEVVALATNRIQVQVRGVGAGRLAGEAVHRVFAARFAHTHRLQRHRLRGSCRVPPPVSS